MPEGLLVPEGARLVGGVFFDKHQVTPTRKVGVWKAVLQHDVARSTVVADLNRQVDRPGWETRTLGDDASHEISLGALAHDERQRDVEVSSVRHLTFITGFITLRDGPTSWPEPEWAPVVASGPIPESRRVNISLGRNGRLKGVKGLAPLMKPHSGPMVVGQLLGGSTGVYWVRGDTNTVLRSLQKRILDKRGFDAVIPITSFDVRAAHVTHIGAGCGGGCGGMSATVVELEGRKVLLLEIDDNDA